MNAPKKLFLVCIAVLSLATVAFGAKWFQSINMNGNVITNATVVDSSTGLFVFVPWASNSLPVPYIQLTNYVGVMTLNFYNDMSNQFLLRSGGNSMLGPLNAGGFRVTNVADPVNALDAVNLGYLNTQTGTVGRAEYDAMTNKFTQMITNLYACMRMRVYSDSDQVIVKSVWTKVRYQVKQYDQEGAYSTNTHRFTPTSWIGFYHVLAALRYESNSQGDVREIAIYKNGTPHSFGTSLTVSGPGPRSLTVSDVVYLSTGDYVEIFTFQDAQGDVNILGGSTNTYFASYKID